MNVGGTVITVCVKSIEKFCRLKAGHAQRISPVKYLFPMVKARMRLQKAAVALPPMATDLLKMPSPVVELCILPSFHDKRHFLSHIPDNGISVQLVRIRMVLQEYRTLHFAILIQIFKEKAHFGRSLCREASPARCCGGKSMAQRRGKTDHLSG